MITIEWRRWSAYHHCHQPRQAKYANLTDATRGQATYSILYTLKVVLGVTVHIMLHGS